MSAINDGADVVTITQTHAQLFHGNTNCHCIGLKMNWANVKT